MSRQQFDYDGFAMYAKARLADEPNLSARALIKEIREGGTHAGSNTRMNAIVRGIKDAPLNRAQSIRGGKGGERSGIARGKKSANPQTRQKAEQREKQARFTSVGTPQPKGGRGRDTPPGGGYVQYGYALEDIEQGSTGRFVPLG